MVSMVSMVGVMFMGLTTMRVVGAFMTMMLSVFPFLAHFFLGLKDDVMSGIIRGKDVDLTRPRQFNVGLDEWHAKCVAESVGQAESFLAQRGSTEVVTVTFVLALERRFHDNYVTEDAVDVVVVAVYVGVCQCVAKANVGIRIGWILDDADRLRCSEADDAGPR